MRILVLLCSPRPGSLNHALAALAQEVLGRAGHELDFHDLYGEGFDPVMDAGELSRGSSLDSLVQTHCDALESSQGLLVFHPDWWGGPPAILKGWVDRVLRQGIAYELEGGDFSTKTWKPLLTGKKALVCVSTDSPAPDTALHFQRLWDGLVLGPCGMETEVRVLSALRDTKPRERSAWMAALEERLLQIFPPGAMNKAGPGAGLPIRPSLSPGQGNRP